MGRASRINARLKSPLGWIVLAFVFAVFMVVGSQRDRSPATSQERVESIARQLACPTCDGESVAESRGAASQAIRREIARLVGDGQLSDGEIVTAIDDSYAENLRLTPSGVGIEALVWILPIVVGGAAVIGVIVAFGVKRRAARTNVLTADSESLALSGRAKSSVVIGIGFVVLVCVGTGLVVTRNTDDRGSGAAMMSGADDSSVSSLLVRARSLGMSDVGTALDLYAEVLAQEPDNVEALTYFGWLTVLSASQISDTTAASSRLESGLVLLRQATIADATYPDAHCFLGISFYRFLDDAQAAKPEIDSCLESKPPSEVAVLVEGLARDIDEALNNPAATTIAP